MREMENAVPRYRIFYFKPFRNGADRSASGT